MLCDSYEQSPSNPLKRVCRECSSTDRHLNRSCAGHIPKHGEIAFALSKPEALAVKKDLGSKPQRKRNNGIEMRNRSANRKTNAPSEPSVMRRGQIQNFEQKGSFTDDNVLYETYEDFAMRNMML